MSRANLEDRASIERAYPREAFEEDANLNADSKAAVLRGVTLRSAAGEEGAFELARSSRHVGELAADNEARFVPAHRTSGAEELLVSADYAHFIEALLAAARSFGTSPPSDRGDDRLRGFHGG